MGTRDDPNKSDSVVVPRGTKMVPIIPKSYEKIPQICDWFLSGTQLHITEHSVNNGDQEQPK